MNKRVLLRIPSGNGVPVDRFSAVDLDEARELVFQGSQDENSWFAGAHVVSDKEDYPRYGYKECDINGVVKDDEAIHLSRANYERFLNSSNPMDDLSENSEASLVAELALMKQQLAVLAANAKQSEAQIVSANKAKEKEVATDKASVTKTPAKRATKKVANKTTKG